MYITEGTLSMMIMDIIIHAINTALFVFLILIIVGIIIAALYTLRCHTAGRY